MKLFGRTENKITKDKSDENVLHLEITEVILVHLILVNNSYQRNSRILYTFIFMFYIYIGIYIYIKFIFFKTFYSEF